MAPAAKKKATSTKVVNTKSQRRIEFATNIQKALSKTVEGIIEAGRILIEAKGFLKPEEFESMLVDLKMTQSTSAKLMSIAGHKVLSNETHAPVLPTNWTTLYQLSKIPEKVLSAKIVSGDIKPEITGKQIRQFAPPPKAKDGEDKKAAKPPPEKEEAPPPEEKKSKKSERLKMISVIFERATAANILAEYQEEDWEGITIDDRLLKAVTVAADTWKAFEKFVKEKRK